VVVAVFAAATAVPGLIAYSTGMLPGPTPAAADSAKIASREFRVTSLAWPKDALGLAATDVNVMWEQLDPSSAIAGLWAYDVRTQKPEHLLGRRATGKGSGFPRASGHVIAWSAWPGRRGSGTPQIVAYDTASTRRWTVAPRGRDPETAGDVVLWIEPGGASPADDAIRGVDAVTDEEYKITAVGTVRDIAASGGWAAWISGRGDDAAVWAGPYRGATRFQLAATGTAVAVDHDRVLWAAAVGRHSTAIVSWDRRSRHVKVLSRAVGAASSLSMSRRYATWLTTRKATGSRVWVYDFKRGRAYPVSEQAGEQASPVIVAGTVFWADRRSGSWELYGRALQP
jgi:hypothetical protein